VRRSRFASILRRSHGRPRRVHLEHRSTLALHPHKFAVHVEPENRRAAAAKGGGGGPLVGIAARGRPY